MSEVSDVIIEEQTSPAEVDPGDHDRYAHYVPKSALNRALITGEAVVALCGKVWVPHRDPERYPVCPTCKEIKARRHLGS